MQLRGVLLELIKIDLVLPTIYAYLQPAQGASKSKAIKELLFNKLRRDFFFFFHSLQKKKMVCLVSMTWKFQARSNSILMTLEMCFQLSCCCQYKTYIANTIV
jgi:hypothetical protein